MKILKKLLIPSLASLAILIAGNSQAMEKPNKPNYNYWDYQKQFTQEEIIANNQVDAATKEILEKNWNKRTEINVEQQPEQIKKMLLEYPFALLKTHVLEEHRIITKEGFTRIIGSQLINKCATENNLAVRAPLKKCYMYGELPLIIMPKVTPSEKPFMLKQIRDLYKLAKLTGLQDMHAANIFNTEEGTTMVIDTEYRSFINDYFGLPYNPIWSLVPGLNKLAQLPMEPEAKKWLDQKIERIAEKQITKAVDYASPVVLAALDACAIS